MTTSSLFWMQYMLYFVNTTRSFYFPHNLKSFVNDHHSLYEDVRSICNADITVVLYYRSVWKRFVCMCKVRRISTFCNRLYSHGTIYSMNGFVRSLYSVLFNTFLGMNVFVFFVIVWFFDNLRTIQSFRYRFPYKNTSYECIPVFTFIVMKYSYFDKTA